MNAATNQILPRSLTRAALAMALLLLATLRPILASPIVLSPQNENAVDQDFIQSALTGAERFWESGDEVLIAVLKNDPATDELLKRYSGMTASKFKNYWQRLAFSGRGKMPKQFNEIDDLVDFVQRNPGAIALVDERHKLPTLKRPKL